MRSLLLALCLGLAACGSGISGAAGAPARIDTAIAPSPLVAGDTATAMCTVYDASGETIDGLSPILVITPDNAAITITGLEAEVTRAGHYSAQCTLADLEASKAPLDVVPALPASITLGRIPDQRIYAIDSTITITHTVSDRFDNPIPDAVVMTTSTPVIGVGPTTMPLPDSFSYGSEGKYHIVAEVAAPTEDMAPVTASVDLVVNQSGPTIACGSPIDGAMLNIAAGAPLTFSGTASDVSGTMTVTVNGSPVAVSTTGSFTAPITARFGINFVEIAATDAYGAEATKVCTFLAASRWAHPSEGFRDTLSLRLNQAAIDDGSRSGSIDSLGDMLFAIANSSGLGDAISGSLASANPLKPLACDSQICPLFGCICLFKSGLEFNRLRIDGPNSDALTLVTDGISTTAQINGLHINLRVHGSVGPIPFDTSGDVAIAYEAIGLTLDPSLAGDSPRVSVRPGSVTAGTGSISTDFNGVDGWIIDHVVVPLAQGALRDAVSARVRDFVANNFNTAVDGIVSNLDVASLDANFDVPRLDRGTVALQFGIGVSSLTTTPNRLLFGIASKFTAAVSNGFTSLGAPIPNGAVLGDPSTGSPAAISAHLGLLNQALHALWKADYFAAMIDSGTLGASSPGLMLRVTTRLPPVVSFNAANQVELALGDIDVAIDEPSLPLHATITVGARVHTDVALVGNSLQFGSPIVDEVHIASDSLSLTEMRQMELEGTLQKLAQDFANASLKNALPTLPIPSFAIPASLAQYGIPMGQLGIDGPSLTIAPPHFQLTGAFAIH